MDHDTFRRWLTELGCTVEAGGDDAVHAGTAAGRLALEAATEHWFLLHHLSELEPGDLAIGGASPASTVRSTAAQIAAAVPLLDTTVEEAPGIVRVRFSAPVFVDGLGQQSFALTVSAMIKAAAALGRLIADQRAIAVELHQLEQRASPAPDAASWRPTHTVTASGLPAWATPDSSTSVIATLAKGTQLQLVGSSGGYAQLQAENGWSGWVSAQGILPLPHE